MNRFVKDFGKYFFYLLVAAFMVACDGDEDNVNPSTTSDFTFAADATTPGKINFTNTSVNASSYLWDFGDGTTSNLASPSHTFPANGTFQVKLTATGAAGGSGKLPGKGGAGAGTSTTKSVSVNNAVIQPSITASMQGSSNFTFTATSNTVSAMRNNGNIFVVGTSSTGNRMELMIPANAVAGGSYTASPQQPASNASITYTNSVSAYTANSMSCGGPATGTIKVNSISATSISGTYTGEVYNVTCSGGYFSILSANFTASF